ALLLTVCGLVTSIILSLLMPNRVYEYITTAAGLMLLYNWLFMLYSFPRLIDVTTFGHVKRYIGVGLIMLAIGGTLVEKASRPGLFVSIIFVALVFIALLIIRFTKKRK